ncbi:hypothetical protein HZH66_014980 [Vespula vulgaris]|uniref:Uncharacterized protein n=1 Tax=Vespula vulgaris TaxID=7454 RepID=A0A834MQ45_VESVU|nr:hypothetical protein HZH66_014980 [Vespula vulgaris]
MVEGEGERLGEVAEEDGWGSDGRSKIRHWGWALEETLYLSPYPHDEYGFSHRNERTFYVASDIKFDRGKKEV